MGTYQYEAMNAASQTVKDQVDAATTEEAVAKIRMQGQFPTRVKEARGQKAAPPASGGRRKKRGIGSVSLGGVSASALAEFTRQLSTLQDAGLPMLRSLKILWQQERAGNFKNTLAQVAQGVEDGATLSESMARHPKVFSRLYVNMVQAGETGGVLDVILNRLAEFMEKAQKLRRRIIGAMIYPIAVITISILIVSGIVIFVVPKFQEIFHDFRATLPKLTVLLLAVADFMAHHFGWLLIVGLPLGLWLIVKLLARTVGGRYALDALKLRLPIVGRILQKTAVARFARTLGTLLAAGVPILDAIGITRDTVGNVVYERALQKVQNAIREGQSFAVPLRAARVCDPLVTNMIDVGEETGDLDKMLLKIADNYDDQVDTLVGSLVSMLEPLMVVLLGGIVGTIVVALFLPIVELLRASGLG
ncbi:MAG TPA: type II secretion system F family protein [Tepidisphaeraceae bacterium]|nr:type II secretion system F family protein [Tepidisphaeraceae bacterium]